MSAIKLVIEDETLDKALKEMLKEEKEELRKLQMFNAIQVAEYLGCTKNNVYNLTNAGILKPIKIGKEQMYSQYMLEDFQKRYEGVDLSNPSKMKRAFNLLG